MKILIITPTPPRSRSGNRVTALRWQRILAGLKHRVSLVEQFQQQSCACAIALHAKRSARSIERFRRAHPTLPLVVALTGTDLYHDLHHSPVAERSLQLASRLVVLQSSALDAVPAQMRAKTRVIYQSAEWLSTSTRSTCRDWEVCVVGHLRHVKDPFRAAMAVRRLRADSQIRVVHIGAALTPDMERRARTMMQTNPRYRWLGEFPRWKARARMARCRLLVLSSRLEGGANVVSEALAASVPVIASKIPGSVGILGDDYPGYFDVGDTRALAALLTRAEKDRIFFRRLKQWCGRRKTLISPGRERCSWRALLRELSASSSTRSVHP